MTWIQTHSGRAFDLLDPKPEQVDLGDIAHALAHINRFTGHVGTYSVAAHSIVVAHIARDLADAAGASTTERLLAYLDGLLHDAHEAYINDLSSPMKRAMTAEVGLWYTSMRNGIQECIEAALGYQPALPIKWLGNVVRHADMLACDAERKVLGMWPESRPWRLPYESTDEHQWLVRDFVDATGDEWRSEVERTLDLLGWGPEGM